MPVSCGDAGAALLLPEDELTETGLEDLLWRLCSTEDKLSELARNSHSCAFPDAAQVVGALCLEHGLCLKIATTRTDLRVMTCAGSGRSILSASVAPA